MTLAEPGGPATTTRLRDRVVDQLRSVRTVERAALEAIDAALEADERRGADGTGTDAAALTPDVLAALRAHRQVAERHSSLLGDRLRELSATEREPSEGVGAALRGAAPEDRDPVTALGEVALLAQISITSLELGERLAEVAGDRATVEVARRCRAGEEDAAAKLRDEVGENRMILLERSTGAQVAERLGDQLQVVYALECTTLEMTDAVLAASRYRRLGGRGQSGDAVLRKSIDMFRAELLDVFRAHRDLTDRHAVLLRARLEELGRTPSARPAGGGGAAAALVAADLGGRDFVTAVRDASVLAQVSIVSLELAERLAESVDDAETAELARECRASEQEIAARIRDAFKHVLSLTLLAQRMHPSRRGSGPGLTSEAESGAAVDEPLLGLA